MTAPHPNTAALILDLHTLEQWTASAITPVLLARLATCMHRSTISEAFATVVAGLALRWDDTEPDLTGDQTAASASRTLPGDTRAYYSITRDDSGWALALIHQRPDTDDHVIGLETHPTERAAKYAAQTWEDTAIQR